MTSAVQVATYSHATGRALDTEAPPPTRPEPTRSELIHCGPCKSRKQRQVMHSPCCVSVAADASRRRPRYQEQAGANLPSTSSPATADMCHVTLPLPLLRLHPFQCRSCFRARNCSCRSALLLIYGNYLLISRTLCIRLLRSCRLDLADLRVIAHRVKSTRRSCPSSCRHLWLPTSVRFHRPRRPAPNPVTANARRLPRLSLLPRSRLSAQHGRCRLWQ